MKSKDLLKLVGAVLLLVPLISVSLFSVVLDDTDDDYPPSKYRHRDHHLHQQQQQQQIKLSKTGLRKELDTFVRPPPLLKEFLQRRKEEFRQLQEFKKQKKNRHWVEANNMTETEKERLREIMKIKLKQAHLDPQSVPISVSNALNRVEKQQQQRAQQGSVHEIHNHKNRTIVLDLHSSKNTRSNNRKIEVLRQHEKDKQAREKREKERALVLELRYNFNGSELLAKVKSLLHLTNYNNTVIHKQTPSNKDKLRRSTLIDLHLDQSVVLPHSRETNNSLLLLDAVYFHQLPRIDPSKFQFPNLSATSAGEYLLATWQSPVTRQYGIGPNAVPPAKDGIPQTTNGTTNLTTMSGGGVTILGEHWWKQQLQNDDEHRRTISSLLYVPILKNAHTSLSNAVGDLRQRIGPNCTVTVYNRVEEIRKRKKDNEKLGKTPGINVNKPPPLPPLLPTTPLQYETVFHEIDPVHSLAFTVLRDPIDRYISSTCEELRLGSAKLREACLPAETLNFTWTAEHTADCLLHSLVARIVENPHNIYKQFLTHQRPQSFLLAEQQFWGGTNNRSKTGSPPLLLSVIPFSQLTQLFRELGNKVDEDASGNAKKVRDRSDAKYYMERAKPHLQIKPKFYPNVTEINTMSTNVTAENVTSANMMAEAHQRRRLLIRDSTIEVKQKQQSGEGGSNNGHHNASLSKTKAVATFQSQQQLRKESHMKQLAQFCKLKPADLKPIHLKILCQIYQMDVQLMRAVGMEVTWCDDDENDTIETQQQK